MRLNVLFSFICFFLSSNNGAGLAVREGILKVALEQLTHKDKNNTLLLLFFPFFFFFVRGEINTCVFQLSL